ncbi:MAG TPA: DUF4031 domain-containing protein [Propionibacteriaceae bacterium]|nr:DUF4031 domain-containing protein [Propionibacteriaceae bacterium]
MILIDPARWPAHGTEFSHLVSDTSLDELHRFAASVGIHPRAFDHDHYDVRAASYDRCVAAGAVEVSGEELVRRLIASGLRVRTPERAPKQEAVVPGLTESWHELMPGHEALGLGLVRRWLQAHRHYHDVRHLAYVLAALDTLVVTDCSVRLAAWFHDAVYDGAPSDEEESARLAISLLTPILPTSEVQEVARLIRLTASHDPSPSDHAGAALCDADLAILAAPTARYDVYVRDVRADYSHIGDQAWAVGRTQVLDRLLSHERLFTTPYGREHWEAPARVNLARERDRWASSG